MSETPRTDAIANLATPSYGNFGEFHTGKYRQLARQLERELAQAHAALDVATNAQEDAEAALTQAQARCAEVEKFRKFVGLLLFDYCENWGTDIGGEMIEEYLLKSGLAAREMMTGPCGEYCQCADINDFPLECNRLSKEAMLAKHDIPEKAR